MQSILSFARNDISEPFSKVQGLYSGPVLEPGVLLQSRLNLINIDRNLMFKCVTQIVFVT